MIRRLLASLIALVAPIAGAEPLQVGADAPDFELQGSDGNRYTLGDFTGKRGLVLAWFPKAFTPG